MSHSYIIFNRFRLIMVITVSTCGALAFLVDFYSFVELLLLFIGGYELTLICYHRLTTSYTKFKMSLMKCDFLLFWGPAVLRALCGSSRTSQEPGWLFAALLGHLTWLWPVPGSCSLPRVAYQAPLPCCVLWLLGPRGSTSRSQDSPRGHEIAP